MTSRAPRSIEPRAAALARLYDLDLVDDPGDLELYRAIAARAGGPILELAVGTGRLAVPLAADGFHVTGVDLDPAMLARADELARQAGHDVAARLDLVEADAVGLRLPKREFNLAFIAFNSLFLVGDRRRQAAVVQALADHLAVGGLAIVDVWLPDAVELAGYDGSLTLQYVRQDPGTGRNVTKVTAATHRAVDGTVTLTAIYEEGADGEPPDRWIRQDRLRLISPDELREMAEAAGLDVEVIAGTYDLDPIGPDAERVVLLAARGRRQRPPGLV